MRYSTKIHFRGFIIISLCCAMAVRAEPVILAELNFDDGKMGNARCSFGAQGGGAVIVSTNAAENFGKSAGSLKGSYPISTGGMYVWGGCDISDLNTNEVYVEFDAKMPLPTKHGLKFLKIFGQRTASGYANSTIGLDYTGIESGKGSLYAIMFGDGSASTNDTQNVIFLDGSNPGWVGRSANLVQIKTAKKLWPASAWGDGWHHFRMHIKFNSGNSAATEVADGEYSVEINGVTYVDAKNVFNRHYSNLPIQNVAFFDWSQGGTAPFDIWYDNITISTGGFVSRPNPLLVNGAP